MRDLQGSSHQVSLDSLLTRIHHDFGSGRLLFCDSQKPHTSQADREIRVGAVTTPFAPLSGALGTLSPSLSLSLGVYMFVFLRSLSLSCHGAAREEWLRAERAERVIVFCLFLYVPCSFLYKLCPPLQVGYHPSRLRDNWDE